MENIKKRFNSFIKYFKFLIRKTLLKHRNKTNNVFINKFKFRKFKISNFNLYLISLIGLLFIYLFYLSIPAFYNKTWVQNTIENKLYENFKINFSISSEITYEILPAPHFSVKNAKILNNNNEIPKQISEIKDLKVFISQKKFFNKEKLKINNLLINKANFSVQPSDFSFFNDFIKKKFSNKEIKIKNSNIFFKNEKNETVSITQISRLFLFYDDLELLNKITLKGEIFKIPFILKFHRNLLDKQNNMMINSKKLKIKFNNKNNNNNKIIIGLNDLSIFNMKLITQYEIEDNNLSFQSLKSQLSNNKLEYSGKVNFYPFDLLLSINLQKINLKKLFNNNSILFELFKSGKLFHNNLSSNVSLKTPNITNSKLLKDLDINFNIENGKINLDKSNILIDKIGLLTLSQSKLILKDNNLLFNGDFNLSIKNSNSFFSFFQTFKDIRKPIKNISFNLDVNFLTNKLRINNFKIDNVNSSNEMKRVLNDFNNSKNQKIYNMIVFKSLVNKIFTAYAG